MDKCKVIITWISETNAKNGLIAYYYDNDQLTSFPGTNNVSVRQIWTSKGTVYDSRGLVSCTMPYVDDGKYFAFFESTKSLDSGVTYKLCDIWVDW